MERSSPLAAMQPPPIAFGPFGCHSQLSSSYSEYEGRLDLPTSNFNFKDLSMGKVPSDYFSHKPVRGSSPTASLAADLYQNFHIDQSPQLPTPRRALFSSTLFGTLTGRDSTTTPPPPSSSPGPGNDSMEISPLPHKAPFVVASSIGTPSDTQEDSTADTSMDGIQDSPSEALARMPLERRRPTLLRPSLSRTKGFSTSAVSLKRVECPPFRFGSGTVVPTTKECSGGSPIPLSRPQSADSPSSQSMGPPRFKQPFSNLNGHTRNPGPPVFGPIRKSTNPLQRPRKQFRRSLSMFEHPGDVMKEEKSNCNGLDSIMDVDDSLSNLQLPHFHKDEEVLPRITKETMAEVLDGRYSQCYDRSLVVDCRFEYEYEGGHIEGAVNHNDKEVLSKQLFQEALPAKTLLIFHCEYSAMRAPNMAKHIRERDRTCNAHRYPNLTFPEIYILDGGYSAFFADYRPRCTPQNYVAMSAKEHESACERGLGRIKQGGRAKLSRAQTFAFGQRNTALDDSPTALPRQPASATVPSVQVSMDIAIGSLEDVTRQASRRMASY